MARRLAPVIIAGGVVVLAGVVAVAALAPVPTPLAASDRLRPIDPFAAQSLASSQAVSAIVPVDQPGCSAAVARDGEVVWAGAAGLADLGGGVPVTTSTRFDMASAAKQFTGTAVLLLQREGALSLSDPIAGYVDDLPEWGATVTLEQLLHQTSGIPDYWVALDDLGIGFSDPADQAATLDAIRSETELESPGTFVYSNSNYVLLAAVVERVSGTSFAEFLSTRIFVPLGLDMVLAPTLQAPDIALSYDENLALQPAGWTSYGHTGIMTTPSELARWGDQYRVGTLVSGFDTDAVDDGTQTGDRYGAGIYVIADGSLSHSGRMGGYITDFAVSADRRTSIAVMCNGRLSPRTALADALWSIWG